MTEAEPPKIDPPGQKGGNSAKIRVFCGIIAKSLRFFYSKQLTKSFFRVKIINAVMRKGVFRPFCAFFRFPARTTPRKGRKFAFFEIA